MFKKTRSAVIAIFLAALLSLSVWAAVYTDFDSYKNFNEDGNPVFNDGDKAGDYWAGEWDSGNIPDGSHAQIEASKGWNGTKALAVWEEDDTANQGLYLYVTPENGISKDYTGAKYLRVWLDLSDTAFRKANFGVTDSHYNLFTTDEENENASEWPFYYLPDGKTEWQTYYHGGDGCFGDAQDSDVQGFKGFFAFPVSDFVIRTNAANHDDLEKNTAANISDVSGVYMFWDYSDEYTEGQNKKFYLDNIEFVKDYKVFDGVLYVAPVEEPAASAAETPATPAPTAAASVAPTTGDAYILILILAVLSALAFATAKKRRA